MKTIDALKDIAWQVGIEDFIDEENEQELINRMRMYINAGHEELGLDPVVIECAEDATDEQIITAINEYIDEMEEGEWD
jgi:CO dehydrogenase/acetyl-CoA synthase beta subunit